MQKSIRRFSLLVLSAVAVSACEQTEVPLAPEGGLSASGGVDASRAALPTIVEIAVGNPDFEILAAAVVATGLADALSGPRHSTVFAPTDAAFATMCGTTVVADCVNTLVGLLGVDGVRNVLLYHVTRGDRNSASILSAGELQMLNGQTADVTMYGGGAYIDGALILATDVRASNGIVHVIGGVMLPDA